MPDDTSRVRVYLAMSLDGFIAGEGDDLSCLSWLTDAGHDDPAPGAITYESFIADVGAI